MTSPSAPFWILGSGGQIGQAWLAELAARGLPARAFSRTELDLESEESLARFEQELRSLPLHERPRALVLTAAYTQVDKAEQPAEKIRAEAINAHAPGLLAKLAASLEIPFVHYSTDYVYEGTGTEPRSEKAPVAPQNAYGLTKLRGDEAVARAFEGRSTPWLVFRTSWVYDATGKNFFRTMLRLFQEKDSLSIVDDQWGAPSYAPHLARASLEAFLNLSRASDPKALSGVYHLVHSGFTTWHGFASAILALARTRSVRLHSLSGIPSAQYPTPAKRPLNSRLSSSKLKQQLGVELPHWEEGLRDCWQAWLRQAAH